MTSIYVDPDVLAAIRTGDDDAFVRMARVHGRRLHVHCYRMLGSVEDAEDVVQETYLRAWRARADFEGRSSFLTWLYRIATNLCLNALQRQPRRLLPNQVAPPATDPSAGLGSPADLPWLQPYPDRWLDELAADPGAPPDEVVVTRETISLAFLTAIQLLPPRQRAVLVLREVLGWSAKETAALLEISVAAANSALQRARATLRDRRTHADPPATGPTEDEREVLARYIEVVENGDFAAFARLLRDDARLVMPPYPGWYEGRDAVVAFMRVFADPGSSNFGDCDGEDDSDGGAPVRPVPTSANRQPALAFHVGDQLMALLVLRIDDGAVAEIVAFPPR